MQKIKKTSGVVCLFFVTTLFLDFASFAWADDVASLQQDVIMAKQKYQAINGKVDTMHSMMDPQPAQPTPAEAQAMIEELKRATSEKQVTPIRIEVPKPRTRFERTGMPPIYYPEYKEKPLTDGNALYKVAISDQVVTLNEAVDIGVANNSKMQALKKKVEVGDAKLAEAKRALLPTMQGVIEEIKGLAGTIPGSNPPHGRYYKGRSYKLNMNQPVFYGGELILTVKQAEENLKLTESNFHKEQNDYIHEVRKAYYGAVKAEYNAKYQADLYELVKQLYGRIKQMRDAKVISEVDFLNVESLYYQVNFQSESAQNDLLSSRMVIQQALNLDAAQEVPVNLKLEFRKVKAQFNELLDLVYRQNWEIREKEYALVAADFGLKIYKAKKYPRVDMRGSFGYLGETFKDTIALDTQQHNLDLEKEWFLGVHVSMPVGPHSVEYDRIKHVYGPTVLALTGSEDTKDQVKFNWMDKLADITDEKSAQAAYLEAKSDYDKARTDATLKLREEFFNLQKSLIQIDSSISKIRYQDKQNSIQEYLMSLQETTPANYLEGLIENSQNKFTFIQAVADYEVAASAVSVTVGDPDYFETQTSNKEPETIEP